MKTSNRTLFPWVVALLFAVAAAGQTRVDLRQQARNVDFSSATFTRPARAGTVLPPSCLAGEFFFKSDAIPGENLYICGSSSNWGLVGTGSAASETACRVAVNGTLLILGTGASTVAPCVFRLNETYHIYAQPTSVSITGGTGSGTAFVYVSALGNFTLEYDTTPAVTLTGNTDVTLIESPGGGFPASALRLARVAIQSGQWGAVTDERANAGGREVIQAGTGISSIQNGVISIDSSVAQKGADNIWTGLNDFSTGTALKLYRVTTEPATGCSAAADVGKVAVNANGAESSHLWICEHSGGTPRWSAVNANSPAPVRLSGTGAFLPPFVRDGGFQTLDANQTYFYQVTLPFAMTLRQMTLSLNGGGGALEAAAAGVYSSGCSLLASARTLGLNITGRLSLTLAEPVLLPPGVYYFALASQSAAAQFSVSSNGTLLSQLLNPDPETRLFTGNAPTGAGNTFALPASCGTPAAGAQPVPNFAWLP